MPGPNQTIMIKVNLKAFPVLAFLVILLLSSCSSIIDIAKYPEPTFYPQHIALKPNVPVSLSIIETGYTMSPEAFVYSGGSLFRKRRISHIAVLVRHPQGDFVFDTGLGKEMEAQFQEHFSAFERTAFKYKRLTTLRENLEANGFNPDSIRFIIPSHLHWDHASGIEDLPNSEVWTLKEEYDFGMSEAAKPPGFIHEQYDAAFINWKFLGFDATPYEVFGESHNLFGDGTVVLVKLPGHTEGSIGMFVNLPSGKRYFFTGDLTWVRDGFERPSERPGISRNKVDLDREMVKEYIVKVHHLMKEKPELKVVPAHDFNAQKDIAHFPAYEK